MVDWTTVHDDKTYEIHKLDDGNERYFNHTNQWTIIATWLGKVRLMNIDSETCLLSISKWKIRELDVQPSPPYLGPPQ
jgi:hypothetical protein